MVLETWRWAVAAALAAVPATANAADWFHADKLVGTAPSRAITLIDKASVTIEGDSKRRFNVAQVLETPNEGVAWLIAESRIDCRTRTYQTLSIEAFSADGMLRNRKATPNPAYEIPANSSTEYFRTAVCDNDWSRVGTLGALTLSEYRERLFAAIKEAGL